jgi:hypothetical protein
MSESQKMREPLITCFLVIMFILLCVSGLFINENTLALAEKTEPFTNTYLLAVIVIVLLVVFKKPKESDFTPQAIYAKLAACFIGLAGFPLFELGCYLYSGEFLYILHFLYFINMGVFISVMFGIIERIRLIKTDSDAFLIIRNRCFIDYESRRKPFTEIPKEWFIMPKSVDTYDSFGLAVSVRNFYYETKDWNNALKISQKLLRDAPISTMKWFTNSLKCDTLTIMIMAGASLNWIRACYGNIDRFLYKTSLSSNLNGAKGCALFAYFTLIEKDPIKAEKAKQRFFKSYNKLKNKVRLTIEKDIIAEIENRVGAGVSC